MRAASYREQGPARSVLTVGLVDTPEPGLGEVRVRLATSGVNPSDVKSRGGVFRRPMAFPAIIPHSDGAGVIDKVGTGVSERRVGERVWTFNAQFQRPFGTAAEYVTLPSGQAVTLPPWIDFGAGACLGIPALTAHRGVTLFGPVAGRNVLVQGGAGAVGHYAVQIAKAKGATVIATVSGDAKASHARAAGADHIVNYRTENVAERVKALTAGHGADLIVEVDIGANAPSYAGILARRGQVAVYGSGAPIAAIPAAPFINLEPTIQFYIVYQLDPEPLKAGIADLTAMLEARTLQHAVARRFPLDEIAAAHEAVESGAVMGNVVVDIAARV
jgi:NADPH2:quinone reductase